MAEVPASQSTIAWQTVVHILGVSTAFLGLIWFLWAIREILWLVFLSCTLAAALYPAVQWCIRHHVPKAFSAGVVYLVFLTTAVVALGLFGGVLYRQGQPFLEQLPQYLATASQFLSQLPFQTETNGFLSILFQNVENILSEVLRFLISSLDYLRVLLQGAMGTVTILVLTYFLLAQAEHFERIALGLFPASVRPRAHTIMQHSAVQVGSYVRGKLWVMLIVGAASWIGLALLGVPYSFLLGMLAFFLEIVPIIGPIIASVFAIVVALGQDPLLALWVAGLFFVIQQLESYALTPMILGKSVGIHPFWILLSILIGGSLIGFVGILLAVPALVLIRVLYDSFTQPALPVVEEATGREPPGTLP